MSMCLPHIGLREVIPRLKPYASGSGLKPLIVYKSRSRKPAKLKRSFTLPVNFRPIFCFSLSSRSNIRGSLSHNISQNLELCTFGKQLAKPKLLYQTLVAVVNRLSLMLRGPGLSAEKLASVLSQFWTEVVLTVVSFLNRIPSSVISGLSLFERRFSTTPDYEELRVYRERMWCEGNQKKRRCQMQVRTRPQREAENGHILDKNPATEMAEVVT
ncbi:hypothetical protein L1987_78853 [Smallanthus sonchifolius]|uniref:Uncharacterized protein n=1 Tax=Smallanthus sonchifolius TaxID=185202 RepID=A0ACB8ZEF0_9ASTR|nr:hypothetical protein L1987_78853 [Smallanthus sonchifolius]